MTPLTPVDRVVLGCAAECRALKRAPGWPYYKPYGGHREDVAIKFAPRAVEPLVAAGLLAYVNRSRSAAYITNAGRAALKGMP